MVTLAACQGFGSPTPPTIRGEIDDAAIRLQQARGPVDVWVELTNVGTRPCDLVGALSQVPPDAMPVVDGRVVMSLGGEPDAVVPLETIVEINGQPVVRADGGVMTDEGWISVVHPGDVARIQIGFEARPDVGERVLICNGAGDYEAGRYAVLAFES